MKRFLLILASCILLITGCGKKPSDYQKAIDTLTTVTQSSDYVPCNIEIRYDRITDDEIVYQLTLDQPQEPMYDVTAVIMHDQPTKDIFPSVGLADSKLHLIPNRIDEAQGIVKGVILVGYIPYQGKLDDFHAEFKVMITYRNEKNEDIKTYIVKKI